MSSKLLLVLSAVALTVMLGVPSAHADQISLGDSCKGTLTVSGTVNPKVTGPVSGCGATWEQGGVFTTIGTWSIGASGTGFSLGTGSNTLAGTIDWTNAGLIGGIETIVGTITVSSVTGFNGEIGVGGTYPIDIELNESGGISGGQIPVPEPATLTLLGTGLIAMAGFLRRKVVR